MQYQQGSALIISLIILVLMIIISTTGMQTTILQERMAGNARDYNNAFQASEAGLADGEQDLVNRDTGGNKIHRGYLPNDFEDDCDSTAANLDGLCNPAKTGDPHWENGSVWSGLAKHYGQRTYGNDAKLMRLPPWSDSCDADLNDDGTLDDSGNENCRRQPRYIMERLETLGSLVTGRSYSTIPAGAVTYYRVTSQGFGLALDSSTPPQPLARAMVQSVYGQ
jgi:Tfp pilus assembly protein PilX